MILQNKFTAQNGRRNSEKLADDVADASRTRERDTSNPNKIIAPADPAPVRVAARWLVGIA